ncbi:MAG: CoA enzyme activase [Thermoanaerobacterales bacterium 50_218]|nr:MAG: CoA enzyme activase [Thermoanaerobacterales bacterium 50_218]HAA90427.1 CoA protein activase [Peptococcaceae bacterium]
MKITYPHMGNLYIVIRALLESLGLELVLPPPTSRRTVELGVRHAPEFACFPFKLNLGNFIEAYELGADTILMAGGVGPCRFGYYAQVQREILEDLGYHMDMVVLEPPDTSWRELRDKIRYLIGRKSWWEVIKAIRFAWFKARAVDVVEEQVLYLRPRVQQTLELEKLYREALKKIDEAPDKKSLDRVVDHYLALMKGLPQKPGPFLRVGLVGEFFTVLEPFANYDIERRLGSLGVEVNRSIYLSAWINEHLFRGLLRVKGLEHTKELAAPYLKSFVGGHGRETVGSTVDYALQGYDGVIHVAPFTCMPEIVAHSILPAVSKDYGIPTLTLYLDEHSGEAGIVTRLEAFVDLMAARRERKLKGEAGKWIFT